MNMFQFKQKIIYEVGYWFAMAIFVISNSNLIISEPNWSELL